MVKSKPFIDKKRATTYRLFYNAEENGQKQKHTSEDCENVCKCPSVEVDDETGQLEVSSRALPDEKRKEIVELGLPDDGYDYLQHIKDRPKRGSHAEDMTTMPEGPWFFQPAASVEPPPEDVKVVDARHLPCQTAASEEDDILHVSQRVTAFSREVEDQHFRRFNELEALDEVMQTLGTNDSIGNSEGDGDLLDDFVLTAAARESTSDRVLGSSSAAAADLPGGSTAYEYDSGASDSAADGQQPCDEAEERSRRGEAFVGSIASTYWRPERSNRGGLSAIDERFETLALDYDSDELGDLEEVEGGESTLEQFHNLLEQCLAEQEHCSTLTGGMVASWPASGCHSSGVACHPSGTSADDDATIAIKKAQELLRASMLDEGPAVSPRGGCGPLASGRTWDCESVLSTQSTMDNHPRLLEELACCSPCVPGRSVVQTPPRRPAGPRTHEGVASGGETHQHTKQEGSCPPILQRSKNETKEEKRDRKMQMKLAKREARAVKKDLKTQHKMTAYWTASSKAGERHRIVPLSL